MMITNATELKRVITTDNGWHGVNANLDLIPKERNALIKKIFKKEFPNYKVSIKKTNRGFFDSVMVTLYVNDNDVFTLDEFIKACPLNAVEIYRYLRPYDNFNQLKYEYENNKKQLLTDVYEQCMDDLTITQYIFHDSVVQAMNYLKLLVRSFSSDESGLYRDYSERDIYDQYYYELNRKKYIRSILL